MKLQTIVTGRDKMNALAAEVSKIKSKTKDITSDQADYVSYEKRSRIINKDF